MSCDDFDRYRLPDPRLTPRQAVGLALMAEDLPDAWRLRVEQTNARERGRRSRRNRHTYITVENAHGESAGLYHLGKDGEPRLIDQGVVAHPSSRTMNQDTRIEEDEG